MITTHSLAPSCFDNLTSLSSLDLSWNRYLSAFLVFAIKKCWQSDSQP